MDQSDGTEFVEQVKTWKANHFSMTDADNNVPRLLRRLADTLEHLGSIDVHDVTFSVQTEGKKFECVMSVYFDFVESR